MFYFIINPKSKSGRGLSIWNMVKQELDNKKIEYSYYITTHAGHATKFANSICKTVPNKKYIIAVGGDGTINEVINGISDYSNVILGYIPSGSSNDLARSMEIPQDPIDALNKIINCGKYIKVDHGILKIVDSLNTPTRKFCTSTGIGLDASICNDALNSRMKFFLNKIGLGKLIYLLITLKQLLTLKFTNATIIVDGIEKHYNKMAFCTSLIQKCEGGGLKMAPKAVINDMKLSICLVYGLSRAKIFLLLPTILFGKHMNFKGIDVFECTTIEIITDKKLIVHVDGEFAGRSSHIVNKCFDQQILMPKM